MNDRRLARLKLLTTGAALLSSTVFAGNPPEKAPEPIHVNSPPPQRPEAADAGVIEPVKPKPEPKKINVNSPKPKP